MRSPLSPILAEILLNEIETNKLKTWPFDLKFYYRYVDDIFLIVTKNLDENLILATFNDLHHKLKFTLEKEVNAKLNFMDVSVENVDFKIITKWYRKLSNTLNFTNWNSSEPKFYKISLIFTMINRLKKICSINKTFKRDIEQLKDSFLWSDYPQNVINKCVKSAFTKSTNSYPSVSEKLFECEILQRVQPKLRLLFKDYQEL